MAWQIGARVLAGRQNEAYLYPATVRWLDGDKVAVDFDDGDQGWVNAAKLIPLNLEVGDRVFARMPVGHNYSPARITRIEGAKIHIEYDDGEPEWTSAGMLRVHPEQWKNVAAVPRTQSSWIVGDRVLARWNPQDPFYYPGTVQAVTATEIQVFFDDGDRAGVPHDKVQKIDIEKSGKVFARWQGGPAYYPAQVLERHGENLLVEYDEDKVQERITISLVRVLRGRIENPWKVGQRVLAQWPPEPFFYPALVKEVDETSVFVHYEDGDQARLLPNLILPLDLREGDTVFARWQAGKLYYPARITRKNGDTLYLQYEDGKTETSSVRMVRVLPRGKFPS